MCAWTKSHSKLFSSLFFFFFLSSDPRLHPVEKVTPSKNSHGHTMQSRRVGSFKNHCSGNGSNEVDLKGSLLAAAVLDCEKKQEKNHSTMGCTRKTMVLEMFIRSHERHKTKRTLTITIHTLHTSVRLFHTWHIRIELNMLRGCDGYLSEMKTKTTERLSIFH